METDDEQRSEPKRPLSAFDREEIVSIFFLFLERLFKFLTSGLFDSDVDFCLLTHL